MAVPAFPAKEASAAATATGLSTEIEDEFLNEDDSIADAKVDANKDDDDGIPDIPDDDDSDEDSDFEEDEDEDPNKLWCICQQPHNNRFMICCDSCSDWYHGKCVGITKKMGKEMEEVGNEWTCPKCENKVEKEATDKQNAQLKDKLKERVATAQQVIPTKKS